MEKVYTGKTKDVYKLNDEEYLLKFKDDVQEMMVYLIRVQIVLDLLWKVLVIKQ